MTKNVKKVPKIRDQGIGLNGSVNNEIVAVFNPYVLNRYSRIPGTQPHEYE